jgi:hypothetical protein
MVAIELIGRKLSLFGLLVLEPPRQGATSRPSQFRMACFIRHYLQLLRGLVEEPMRMISNPTGFDCIDTEL